MADFTLSWNDRPARDAITDAFQEAMFLLGGEFTRQINRNKWSWPNEPTTRDIVDTGQLRASQQEQISDSEAEFSWNVEYAAYVHEGYVSRSGNTFPARPWTREAIKAQPPQKTMRALLGL